MLDGRSGERILKRAFRTGAGRRLLPLHRESSHRMRLPPSYAFLPFFLIPLDVGEVAELATAPRSPAVAAHVADTPADEAHRERERTDECRAPRSARGRARSIGLTNHGRLARGRFLGESDLIHHVDAHGCNFWGTQELVSVVSEVAAAVAEEHPNHRLTVGELSKRGGGDIIGHGSHENGRDVDLGFYFVDQDGQPYEPDRLLEVGRDGTARVDDEVVTFDVARNWTVVETLLSSDEADVSFILVGWRIRRWLLDHARGSRVDRELYRRASRVLVVPRRGRHPHRNHFHVRIFCPEAHDTCHDRRPLWGWVAEARAERATESEARAERATESEPPDDSTHADRETDDAQPSGVRSAASAASTAASRS
jgi:penicillin-insensitive murein endopeptidase